MSPKPYARRTETTPETNRTPTLGTDEGKAKNGAENGAQPRIAKPVQQTATHTNHREDHQMSRNRASAKKAGTAFETLTADYLAAVLEDDRIERRARNGGKDRGDIAGVRVHGERLVLECKNTSSIQLGTWATEAETERGNDDALAGVVVHKRRGKGLPADQWVTMTLADFAAILSGARPDDA